MSGDKSRLICAIMSRKNVESFLSDLDSFGQPETSAEPSKDETDTTNEVKDTAKEHNESAKEPRDPKAVLDFLDEITNSRPESTPPVTQTAPMQEQPEKAQTAATSKPEPENADTQPEPAAEGGAWGWGSMWSQASSVLQQAKTAAEQNLANESAQRKWGGMVDYVKNVDVDKFRKDIQATVTDFINAVAPPISEHEVIQVYLSHDMVGYHGVETLVYRALAKVMEQVQGGDLVVNRGPSDTSSGEDYYSTDNEQIRNLNHVESLEAAAKLAHANLDSLMKEVPPTQTEPKTTGDKATVCPIYLRLQPALASLPFSSYNKQTLSSSTSVSTPKDSTYKSDLHLFFLFFLIDPSNQLQHQTVSQAMPASWLDIPFEENEWVEEEMVHIIRKGVEIIGQEYVSGRQTGRSKKSGASTPLPATEESHSNDTKDSEKQ